MRIAINCRSFLKKEHTGIGRYAYHLVRSLADIDGKNGYQLYVRKGPFSFSKRTPRLAAKNFTTRVDWFGRGLDKTLKDIDVCHFPSPGPIERPQNAKVIVTVHDVIFKAFPQGHTRETIESGERQFQQIREKAAKIICCSQSTARDLERYFQIPKDRIALVYPGVDKGIFYPIKDEESDSAEKVLAEKGITKPFLLSVGTIEPRKNLVNSIRAFHVLRTQKRFPGYLVVIGMGGWLHEDLTALIEKLGLEKDIVFLGFVPDRELRYFYNKAEAFLFPSHYEGFGFPILEAFSCGVPVVTSNVSSCPEVAGDAALTVDPGNPGDIAEALRKIVSDQALKKILREKGLKRANDFDFRKTAGETLKVYEEVYGL